MSTDNPKAQQGDDEELVLTPGGYRPRSDVHHVGPDEAVQVDEAGRCRIIPRVKEKGERVHPCSSSVQTPIMAPMTTTETVNAGLAALPRLADQLVEDRSIDQVEALEEQAKAILLRQMTGTVSGAVARQLAAFQHRVGLLLKYKSYAVKASAPLGYSVFLQTPGEGFSFQQHLSRKVEIFHVLDAAPGAFAFLSSFEEWQAIYDEARFNAWLAGELGAEEAAPFERFRIPVQPGDVLVIHRLGVVHTVFGCVLEEFATASTDLVDRLHDQNEGRSIPERFTRATIQPRLAELPVPQVSRRVRVTEAGAIRREPLPVEETAWGRRMELGTLPGIRALHETLHPGKTVGWTVAPDVARSLFVLQGHGRVAVHGPKESAAPESVALAPGETVLLAPGCSVEITAGPHQEFRVSIQETPPDVALLP